MNKKLIMVVLAIGIASSLTGCKSFNKPQITTISPSETAFLIPLVGDTTKQGAFQSEALLSHTKVSTKEVTIPHRWVKMGRTTLFIFEDGEWRASATLIKVNRATISREWTSDVSGTSIKNQGIVAESKESIGFMSQMNCSAQIDENNAVRFLYRYNNKALDSIMDTEIRAKIESSFVEECGKLSIEQILNDKESIMNTVRKEVIPYFKERGINVTTIGMKGEFTYLDKGIQASINKKFTAQKELDAQKIVNETTISKASADSKAVTIQASTIQDQIKLKQIENEQAWIAKWDGKQSQVQTGTGSGTMIQIPSLK